MIPGHVRTFYQARKALVFLALAAPVIVLAGLWLLVTQVLMVPRVPDATTPADQVMRFIVHEKGLPRLSQPRAEAVFKEQVRRLTTDPAFREAFLREVRTASPEASAALREHLFDVYKPLLMADIRQYNTLEADARPAYLDERIVHYNRVSRALGATGITAEAAQGLLPSKAEALQLLLTKTTDEERQLGLFYQAALRARVEEVLADPELTAQFEQRITASPVQP